MWDYSQLTPLLMLEMGLHPQAIFYVSLKKSKAMALRIKESSSGKSFNVWDGPTLLSFSKKTFGTIDAVENFIKKSKGNLEGGQLIAENRIFFGEVDRGEELGVDIKRVKYTKQVAESTVQYEEEEA